MFCSTTDDTVTDVGDCARVSRPGLCGLAWYVAVDVVNDCIVQHRMLTWHSRHMFVSFKKGFNFALYDQSRGVVVIVNIVEQSTGDRRHNECGRRHCVAVCFPADSRAGCGASKNSVKHKSSGK